MLTTDVIVIGSGWSGLMACKFCLEENLQVTVLESRSGLGGVWRYTPNTDIPSVMESTEMTSSSGVTEMSDFPMPPKIGEFPIHTNVLAYLTDYANKFNLFPSIEFNKKVTSIKKEVHNVTSHNWVVTTSEGDKYLSKYLVVSTGLNQTRNETLKDTIFKKFSSILHSQDIKSLRPEHKDKSVLLVGGGETASDIALQLLKDNHARKVYWSIPNGQHFFRKVGKYLSKDKNILVKLFPFIDKILPRIIWDKPVSSQLMRKIIHLTKFKHGARWACKLSTNYSALAYQGHGCPEWKNDAKPFRMYVNKSSEILNYIDYKRLIPKPGIVNCEKDMVSFNDNTSSRIDNIILCTGYKSQFKFLPKNFNRSQIDDRYKFVWDLDDSTIAFIGFVRPIVGSNITIAEMQCRWVSRVFSGKVKLLSPKKRTKIAEKDKIWWRNYFKSTSRRIRGLVDLLTYLDDIAELADSKPNYKALFFRSPIKWYIAVTAPYTGCQFLLNDPNLDEQNMKTLKYHYHGGFKGPIINLITFSFCRLIFLDLILDWLSERRYKRQIALKTSSTSPTT